MKYLKSCGEPCVHIHVLPVYHLSLPAHNSHHGSFGRGISEGAIDCRWGIPTHTLLFSVLVRHLS